MKFKTFRPGTFLLYLFVACLYPIYSYVSAQSNPLLAFLDSLTIMGFVFVIFGIVNSLISHGDFDISEYVVKRSLEKGNIKPFRAFVQDKNEERQHKFNYPLFTGIFQLILSLILASTAY